MPLRIDGERRFPDCVPDGVIEDDGQNRQVQGRRGLVAGDGIGEHIRAIADAGDDETIGLGELRAERRRNAPAETASDRMAEIAVSMLERHGSRIAAELSEDDGIVTLMTVETVADPRIGR